MKKLFAVLTVFCFLGLSADLSFSKGGGSVGGGRSFSGGSSSGGKSFSGGSSSGGKSFSGSDSGKGSGKSFSGSDSGKSSTGKAPDSATGRAMAKEGSAKSYADYKAKNYSPDMGKTRDFRETQSFSQRSRNGWYTPSRTIIVYHDPYSNNFLMYASILWMFHHWDNVDRNRYSDDQIRDLEARMRVLENQGLKRDPKYNEEGMDPDLQYAKDKVKYSSGSGALPWVVGGVCVAGLGGLGYWLLFRRKMY